MNYLLLLGFEADDDAQAARYARVRAGAAHAEWGASGAALSTGRLPRRILWSADLPEPEALDEDPAMPA